MNQALTDLYALQQVDTALAVAARKYQALDPGRAEQAAAAAASKAFEEVAHSFHATSGSLKDSELELQGVEKKAKDFESKLYSGKVQNPKELQSIQEEIEALGRQRGRLDEQILTLMEEVEVHRAQEAQAKATLEAADAALAEKTAQYKAAARVLAVEIRDLTGQREKLVAPIPAALLKRYDSIRASKAGTGIGKIDDGRCSACHTNLPTNLIRSVEDTDRVEVCENCGRILCILP